FAVGLLQLRKDLFAVNVDRARGLDTEAHLIAAYLEHGHHDLVTDHDALVGTPSEHEHGVLPPWGRRGGRNGAYEVAARRAGVLPNSLPRGVRERCSWSSAARPARRRACAGSPRWARAG